MQFDWSLFIAATGLAFVFEGAAYFLFADKLPALFAVLAAKPPVVIRVMGGIAIVIGLAVLAFARNP